MGLMKKVGKALINGAKKLDRTLAEIVYSEETAKVLSKGVQNLERHMEREIQQEYKTASRSFNESDKESTERYTKAKENLSNYTKMKQELDKQAAKVNYNASIRSAAKSGDSASFFKAEHEYKKAIAHSNMQVSNLYKLAETYNPYNKKDNFVENLILYYSYGCLLADKIRNKHSAQTDDDTEYYSLLNATYCERLNNEHYRSSIKKQDDLINKVVSGKIELVNNDVRGKFGEMYVDQDLRKKGYVRISNGMITSFSDSGHQGVDGIYCNEQGNPRFIIVETKYNSSKLSTTKKGYRQGSLSWLFGEDESDVDRVFEDLEGQASDISDDLGMELFEDLLTDSGSIKIFKANVTPDYRIIYSELDIDGYEKHMKGEN